MRTATLIAMLLAALLLTAAVSARAEEQAAAGDAAGDAGEGAPTEEPPFEMDPNADYTPLINLCKKLKSSYVPLVEHKFNDHTEAKIMTLAGAVGQALDHARHEHLKKDHEHFTCAEAKTIVEHSATKEFMDNYNSFITNSLPGKTNKEVIALVQEMRKELLDSRLVNEGSIEEIDDALGDLLHLEQFHDDVVLHYKNVLAKKEDCTKDYVTFIEEMNKISTDKLPNWEHIHYGLKSLLTQCHEDDMLKAHLGDL